MTPSTRAAVLLVACLTGACGASGAGTPTGSTLTSSAGSSASSASSASLGSAATAARATTAPATTAPPTSAPATSATVTPPTVGEGLTSACLQGEWVMTTGTTDLFVSTLIPFAPASVPIGSTSMTFTGDRVQHYTNIVVRFTVPEGYVEAPLDTLQEGTFVVAGRQVLINVESTTGGWGTFTGQIGGVTMNIPVPPVGNIPGIAGGPAQCTPTQLSIQYTSGVSDAVAYFDRIR